MNTNFNGFYNRHRNGESATDAIAHFSGSLAALLLVAEVQSASSSRLARKPEKRTLAPVQPRNLGSLFLIDLSPFLAVSKTMFQVSFWVLFYAEAIIYTPPHGAFLSLPRSP